MASGFCTIKPECLVIHLEAGAADRITQVHYVDAKGQRRVVSGQAVVVACGAVETPRLLLTSTNRYAPDGIANESGQVGRHFMETIFWVSSGLHREPLGSFRGLPADSGCWDFNVPDAIPDVIGGFCLSPAMAEADLIGPINYAKRVVSGWGRKHKAEMRQSFGRVLSLKAVGECLPKAQSFIDLDPKQQDAFGLPLARINTHLVDMDMRRLAFMAKTTRDILRASGADDIFEEYGAYDFFSSTHVFGTCRMGTDPQTSVVDPYGRSHGWKNLWIADASVFPSSGGGEGPSLTIEALALRTADALYERAQKREL